jgi:hypothetical protein
VCANEGARSAATSAVHAPAACASAMGSSGGAGAASCTHTRHACSAPRRVSQRRVVGRARRRGGVAPRGAAAPQRTATLAGGAPACAGGDCVGASSAASCADGEHNTNKADRERGGRRGVTDADARRAPPA